MSALTDDNYAQGVDQVDIPCVTAAPVGGLVDSGSVPRATVVDYERFAARYPAFRSVPDVRSIVIESILCGHYDGMILLEP